MLCSVAFSTEGAVEQGWPSLPCSKKNRRSASPASRVKSDVQTAKARNEEKAAAKDPIVVGSTLSLTGFVRRDRVSSTRPPARRTSGTSTPPAGCSAGPSSGSSYDDESDPAKVTALYERLISQDRVDLIMGPYATPNIVAAQAVAERHGYVLPNHTAVLTYALTYDASSRRGRRAASQTSRCRRRSSRRSRHSGGRRRRIAFVTNTGGSTNFISYGPPNSTEGGAVEQARRMGFDVVLDLKYPPTVSDWGSIAAQVGRRTPISSGTAGSRPIRSASSRRWTSSTTSRRSSSRSSRRPGRSSRSATAATSVLSITLFEPNGRLLKRMGTKAQTIVSRFAQSAAANGLNYRVFDSQATASWTAWEVLTAGVRGARSLDNERVCNYLRANGSDTTFVGKLKFNPALNNFSVARNLVKQIQNRRWVVVWPPNLRVARLQGPPAG